MLALFVLLAAPSGATLAQSTFHKLDKPQVTAVRKVSTSIPGARVASEQSRGSLNIKKVGIGTALAAVASAFTGDTGSAVAIQKSGTTGAN